MRLVITPHRPLRKILIAIAGAIGVALAIAIALDYGHWKAIAGSMVSTGKKRTLLEEVRDLRSENERLQFELVRLRRGEEVNRHTRQENHAQLIEVQNQLAALNQELDFYRDILGSTDAVDGPKVKGLQVKPLPGTGRYGYKIILTHVDRDDRVAEGALKVGFSGELNGGRTTLAYDDAVESGPEKLDFKFKHFRLFEGTLKMPEGFVPQQVHVDIRRKNRRSGGFRKTYDWASVLN